MAIKGITKLYRPQRQGKIHLGIKAKKKVQGKEVEYPQEVDYFVMKECPELIKIYGPDPEEPKNPGGVHKELHVTLASARLEKEDFAGYIDKVFPQYLKRYRASGLFCRGDGEMAVGVNEKTGEMEEIDCPCDYLEKGDCKRIGILRIRIQDMPTFNIYQITTSSFNSIVNINSFMRDLCEYCIVNGVDVSNVKLVLRRAAQDVQRLEKGKISKSKHYIMMLDLDSRYYKSIDDVRTKALPQRFAKPIALPVPDESRDDLYYPTAGFAPEESAQEEPAPSEATAIQKKDSEKTPEDKEAELVVLAKKELEVLVKEYIELKKVPLTESLRTKVTKLKGLDQYRAAIDWFKAEVAKAKKQPALPLK